MVVDDDREFAIRQGPDDFIVDLERGLSLELRVGSNGIVGNSAGIVNHFVGPLEADGVDANILKVGQDVTNGDTVKTEGDIV